jgi:hypothetical protein
MSNDVFVQVKIPPQLLKHLRGLPKGVFTPVLTAVATEVQTELSEQKPPSPKRGAMKFTSRKQRAFVMASIRDGSIKVPYKRGLDAKSERMNRSFKLVNGNLSVQLHNMASYMRYVIGNIQARIHQNRWMTGEQAVRKVQSSGKIDRLVQYLLGRYFIGG